MTYWTDYSFPFWSKFYYSHISNDSDFKPPILMWSLSTISGCWCNIQQSFIYTLITKQSTFPTLYDIMCGLWQCRWCVDVDAELLMLLMMMTMIISEYVRTLLLCIGNVERTHIKRCLYVKVELVRCAEQALFVWVTLNVHHIINGKCVSVYMCTFCIMNGLPSKERFHHTFVSTIKYAELYNGNIYSGAHFFHFEWRTGLWNLNWMIFQW
jgi:hypothetical protein